MSDIFIKGIKSIYTRNKIQWLFTSISTILLIIITSSEVWNFFKEEIYPQISIENLMTYCICFFIMLFIIHVNEVSKYISNSYVILGVSFFIVFIDVLFIILVDYLLLNSISVLPQNIFQAIGTLLIVALPACLGVMTISTMSSEYLKKKADLLEKEVNELKDSINNMQKEWTKISKEFKDYKEYRSSFDEKYAELDKKTKGDNDE